MATRIEDNPEEYEHIIKISGVELDKQEVALVDPFNCELEDIKSMLKSDNRNLARRIDTRLKKAKDGAGTKQIIPTENAYSLFDIVEPPYNLATLARLYEASAPNYSAINAKVAHLVGLGYDFELTDAVRIGLEEVKDDEARLRKLRRIEKSKYAAKEWFDSVSEDRSFIDVMTRVVTDLEATGTGYLEIGRTTRGEIGYIGHIPSHTVRVRRAKDGFVQMADGKFVYFANFGQERPNLNVVSNERPNELIQFKQFTPTNTYYGVPDIVAAKESAYGLISANAFNLDYFNNKAVPRYVVSVEGAKLEASGERKLLEFLRGLKGGHHRTIVVPLPVHPGTGTVPKLVFNKVETDVQEGSFTKYKAQSRDEVLMAHRTPANKVGSTSESALSGARDLDKTFKEQVIRPKQELIESRVNWIVKEMTNVFLLRFNEFTLTDEDTQSQIDERDLRMGVLLPNERRGKLKLPPRDGGDEPMALTAQQQADMKATALKTRERDANRSAKAPDKQGEARNPKGEGRKTP